MGLQRKLRIRKSPTRTRAQEQPPDVRPADISAPSPAPVFAPPPSGVRRALHLFQALLRFIVPAYSLIWGGGDPAQLVLIYFFDTWLSLVAVFALMVMTYNPVRKWDTPSIYELFSSTVAIIFGAVVVASFVMLVVAFPLLWVHATTPLQDIIRNPAFQTLVMWHLIFAATAFASQAWELSRSDDPRLDEAAARFADARFGYVFLRWFLVYALMFVPFVEFAGTKVFTILCVVLYSGFSLAVALFPERFEALYRQLFSKRPDESLPRVRGQSGKKPVR